MAPTFQFKKLSSPTLLRMISVAANSSRVIPLSHIRPSGGSLLPDVIYPQFFLVFALRFPNSQPALIFIRHSIHRAPLSQVLKGVIEALTPALYECDTAR
jgi:hypothetical protein